MADTETPITETTEPTEPVEETPATSPATTAKPAKPAKAAKAAAAPAADDTDDTEVVEEIDYAELQRLRDEAAAAKATKQQLAEINKQLKALQAENDGYKREKLTTEEKLQADAKSATERAATLQQQLHAAQARLEIAEVARELKVNPRTAEKLILASVTFDDDGKPTNVRALLDAEIAADPNLVARPAASSTPANGDAGRRDRKVLTLDDVRAMSPDEINARWKEIEPLMSGAGASRA